MWRGATRGKSVDALIQEHLDNVELEGDDGEMGSNAVAPDKHLFNYEFKSIGKQFQKELFHFHDAQRKNLNKLYKVRAELEAIVKQSEAYATTGAWPNCLNKLVIPNSIKGEALPQEFDARARTCEEYGQQINDHDVKHRLEFQLKLKSIEIEQFRVQASLAEYTLKVTTFFQKIIAEIRTMDLQSGFSFEDWVTEATAFVCASYEHLVFGKAAHQVKLQELQKAKAMKEEVARQAFQQLPS